jgi:hypothetical protein
MMNAAVSLFIAFLFFAGNPAIKPESKVVKWTFEVRKKADKEYDLVFKAHIADGFHIYSQHIGPDGPIPTSFTFQPSGNYKRVDSVMEVSGAVKKHDENFDMDLTYFVKEAEFVQHIQFSA